MFVKISKDRYVNLYQICSVEKTITGIVGTDQRREEFIVRMVDKGFWTVEKEFEAEFLKEIHSWKQPVEICIKAD